MRRELQARAPLEDDSWRPTISTAQGKVPVMQKTIIPDSWFDGSEAWYCLLARRFRYAVHMFSDLRFPLVSHTLVTELMRALRAECRPDTGMLARVLRQSLRYIGFALLEFVEFKQKLSDRLSAMHPTADAWTAVNVQPKK